MEMGVSHNGYADPSPYPEIRVLRPNRRYALMLMDDYAGRVSEMTATNQYIFHDFVEQEEYPEIGDMLEKIAITEMMHMEMLAETIIKLGVEPVFRGGTGADAAWWNARLVYYGNDLCDRLEADLKSEYQAIANYQRHIIQIDDPYVQAILARIIMDEKVHVELFKKTIAQYCKGE